MEAREILELVKNGSMSVEEAMPSWTCTAEYDPDFRK